ncbi:DUF2066 domain-containing protein [Pseudomonas xionganensis]|uniref:DUF2066 domain-containing protein n=1 Tax=Pseudomonas xionganensis TaxID=2654845 RepID=A0A6I4KUE5_9PSED|nr:DUF2066 domain-containing protein [Pseudomonas xionganensis]MVW75298.1 DUF2066 domain-containing protein [Pseudomonas xionganensis]
MRVTLRLLLASLPLFGLPAWAAPVTDLYEVREAVESQQPEARDAALVRALDTLVLRLTGSNEALSNPAVAELRKDPKQIISQYGYEGERLLVEFDPLSTERSLRQGGLALWGANRPAILVWWLSESIEGSSLLGDGQAIAAPLREAGQYRGLPLRLPLADLSEQLLANSENLGADQPKALQEASERYAADALLAVQAREADGQWQAQWRLWLGETREQGKTAAEDQASLADAVLLAVSQRLAPRFIVAPGAASTLTLEVQGTDLGRYAELQRLLEPFAAQLLKVEGDRLTFALNASAEQLRAQLALARLQEVVGETPVDASAPLVEGAEPAEAPRIVPRDNILRFRW